MRISSIAIAAALLCASVQAQVLDDFESGNVNAYTGGSGSNVLVNATGAYSGNYGVEFGAGSSAWLYRTDVMAQPGDTIRAKVHTGSGGRFYLGFGASASGCWSAVLATNTTELLLQQNASYGYSDQSSSPQTYVNGVWHLVEVDWALDGTVIVNLYDDTGSTLVNSTPPVQGPTVGGGIAFRGFGTSFHLDDITANVGSFTNHCSGSDPNPGCPCGNLNNGSTPDAGCANSFTASGALLEITGQPVISASTLLLTGTNLPPGNVGIFFQGMSLAGTGQGIFLGDGRLCAGGQLRRLELLTSDAQGGLTSSVNVATTGNVTVPGTRFYQLWYKDIVGSPCGSGTNLTNALEVTWTP